MYSNTNPPVALTHIFCDEIKKECSIPMAHGFHSEALVNKENIELVCAKPTNNERRCVNGFSWAECKRYGCFYYPHGIEVYDLSLCKYFIKETNVEKSWGNKFFPITMDATEIVDKAKEVLKNGVEINLGEFCLKSAIRDGCSHSSAVKIIIYCRGGKEQKDNICLPC